MSFSINEATILGNVGSDFVVRTTQAGKKVANFSLATATSYKDDAGEWNTHTTWHKIVVLNSLATEYLEQNIEKGDRIFVRGELQTRKYTDAKGIERYITEIAVKNYTGFTVIGKKSEKDPVNSYYDYDIYDQGESK